MRRLAACLIATPLLFAATGADRLPLTRGIYVAKGHACKGAANVDIVSYWGGNNAINVSQVECSIRRLSHVGTTYTVVRACKGIQGDDFGTDTVKLVILDRKTLTLDNVAYRWCGTKVEF